MAATHLIDLEGVSSLGYSIVPGTTISSATTTDGTAVDCQTFEGPIHGFFLTGNAGDASTVITFSLVECATSGGSYSAIADGALDALAASATANDNLVMVVSAKKRTMRYVKARVVTAGGTPSVPASAFILGRKKISGAGNGAQVNSY